MSVRVLRLLVAALTVVAIAVIPAATSAKTSTLCERAYNARVAVIKKQGKRAPGRNICRYGIATKDGKRAATTREKAQYLRALNRLKAPTHYPLLARVAVAPAQAPAGTLTASVAGTGAGGSSNPNVNPQCESGGNPQVVDSTGQYWGKYQFDRQTYERYGGTNYGNASEAEQDAVAARVTYDAWPNC